VRGELDRMPAGRHRHELLLELRDRAVHLFALPERLAVPSLLAFGKRHAFPFDRAGENHRRPAAGVARLEERVENRGHVVAVDDERVPAERAPAACELLQIVVPHRRAALAETVHVGDAAQVVEAVDGRDVARFPHGTFCRLTVAEQHVRAIRRVDAPRVERGADGGTDALAERSGGHVDEGQARRRVPFEIRSDVAQLEQLFTRERAGFGPRRVQNRRRMSFRQDEAVRVRVVRIFRIESHLAEEQRRHQLGHRAAARRMTAAGFRGGANRIDAKPCRDVLEGGNQ
jgi:hypothetical protein